MWSRTKGIGTCLRKESTSITKWDLLIFVGNSLVDMLAKCGNFKDARRMLPKQPSTKVVTWSDDIRMRN
jgi:hypothetical protein